MTDAAREREEWIEAGRWLIARLQARYEDRAIEEDGALPMGSPANGGQPQLITEVNETEFLETHVDEPLLLGAGKKNKLIEEESKKDKGKIPKKKPNASDVRDLQKQKTEAK